MAAIAYGNIRDQIKGILEGDARTSAARVYVEEEPQFGIQDVQQAILVYTDRRSAPRELQRAAVSKRTTYLLNIVLAVVYFSLESYKAACDGRDTLLGNVELVLMANSTINDTVNTSWLEGGELYSVRDAQSSTYVAVAETLLVAEVSAINT